MLKIEEAERLIVAEMRERLPRVPYRGTDGGMLAYQQLLNERPDLFRFRTAVGDKWQLVQAWLRKHRLVERFTP